MRQSEPRRTQRLVPIVLSLFLAMVPGNAGAREPGVTGLDKDAASYAAHFGVTQDAARYRLQMQTDVGLLDEQLESGGFPWYGGLEIQHQPDWRVVVYSTEESPSELGALIATQPFKAKVSVASVKYSLSALIALQRRIAGNGDSPATWTYIDVARNRVVVYAYPEAWDAFVRNQSVPLPEDTIELHRSPDAPVTAALFGGQTLTRPSGNPDCTSGFSVYRTNNPNVSGVVTAGHCYDELYKGSTHLPFADEAWFGNHDEQFNRKNGLVLENKIKDDDSGGTRQITGKVGRGNQSNGDYVCKYGFNGGYACGLIESKTAWPSASTPNPDNTFILVVPATADSTNDDLVDGGDSGGPVFVGNNAWGIVHGCLEYPNDTIYQCDYAFNTDFLVYTAINYVENGVGVTLLTQ